MEKFWRAICFTFVSLFLGCSFSLLNPTLYQIITYGQSANPNYLCSVFLVRGFGFLIGFYTGTYIVPKSNHVLWMNMALLFLAGCIASIPLCTDYLMLLIVLFGQGIAAGITKTSLKNLSKSFHGQTPSKFHINSIHIFYALGCAIAILSICLFSEVKKSEFKINGSTSKYSSSNLSTNDYKTINRHKRFVNFMDHTNATNIETTFSHSVFINSTSLILTSPLPTITTMSKTSVILPIPSINISTLSVMSTTTNAPNSKMNVNNIPAPNNTTSTTSKSSNNLTKHDFNIETASTNVTADLNSSTDSLTLITTTPKLANISSNISMISITTPVPTRPLILDANNAHHHKEFASGHSINSKLKDHLNKVPLDEKLADIEPTPVNGVLTTTPIAVTPSMILNATLFINETLLNSTENINDTSNSSNNSYFYNVSGGGDFYNQSDSSTPSSLNSTITQSAYFDGKTMSSATAKPNFFYNVSVGHSTTPLLLLNSSTSSNASIFTTTRSTILSIVSNFTKNTSTTTKMIPVITNTTLKVLNAPLTSPSNSKNTYNADGNSNDRSLNSPVTINNTNATTASTTSSSIFTTTTGKIHSNKIPIKLESIDPTSTTEVVLLHSPKLFTTRNTIDTDNNTSSNHTNDTNSNTLNVNQKISDGRSSSSNNHNNNRLTKIMHLENLQKYIQMFNFKTGSFSVGFWVLSTVMTLISLLIYSAYKFCLKHTGNKNHPEVEYRSAFKSSLSSSKIFLCHFCIFTFQSCLSSCEVIIAGLSASFVSSFDGPGVDMATGFFVSFLFWCSFFIGRCLYALLSFKISSTFLSYIGFLGSATCGVVSYALFSYSDSVLWHTVVSILCFLGVFLSFLTPSTSSYLSKLVLLPSPSLVTVQSLAESIGEIAVPTITCYLFFSHGAQHFISVLTVLIIISMSFFTVLFKITKNSVPNVIPGKDLGKYHNYRKTSTNNEEEEETACTNFDTPASCNRPLLSD